MTNKHGLKLKKFASVLLYNTIRKIRFISLKLIACLITFLEYSIPIRFSAIRKKKKKTTKGKNEPGKK